MRLFNKIKNWFFEKYVYRYLVEFPFKTDFQNKQKKLRKTQNPKNIIEFLSSDKYKNYFYKATTGQYSDDLYTDKRFREKYSILSNSVFDKIKKLIVKFYLYLFQRKTYDEIQIYIRKSDQYSNLCERVDYYLSNTTYEERINNAVNLNVLDRNFVIAQTKMMGNKEKRIFKIIEQNAR